LADAFTAADALARHAKPIQSAWRDEARAAIAYRPAAWDTAKSGEPNRVHPVQALRPLQALLDAHPDAVLVSDGGEIGQWAQACLAAPNRVINGVAGSIGAALPFALAARLAKPDAPVIAVMGDGTFGFHAAEIDTAVRYKLAFVCAVGNDARWNAEYQIQLRKYGRDRLVGCELLPTRYDQVSAAFGGFGELVTDAREVLPAAKRAIQSGLPACLNIMIQGLPAPNVKR
jgi:acetolactate synthase-1/2/3 large subunit